MSSVSFKEKNHQTFISYSTCEKKNHQNNRKCSLTDGEPTTGPCVWVLAYHTSPSENVKSVKWRRMNVWELRTCANGKIDFGNKKKKNKKNGGACAPEVKRRLKCVCVCLLCFKCNCESFVILVLDVLALFNTLHSSTQLTDWDSDPNNFIFIIFNLHGTINKPFNIWSRFHTYSNEKHSHQHRPHVLRIFILFFFAERGNVINRFSLNEKHSLETNLGSLPNWILHHP